MYAIGRLFAIVIGYSLAVLSAAACLLAMHVGGPPEPPEKAIVYWLQFLAYGSITASFIGATCFVPMVIFAVVAETWRLRSFLVHVGFGALVGIVVSVWAHQTDANLVQSNMTAMIATGIIGGGVYWLIAGRFAGWIAGEQA